MCKLGAAVSKINDKKFIKAYGSQKVSDQMQACISQAEQGLEAGLEPALSFEGTSGSYIIKSISGET